MANSVHVSVEWPDEANQILQDLPSADRFLGLKKALKKAAKIVEKRAKQLCPKPEYPGDKPGLKPLRDTISTVERGYSHAIVIVVGPAYPAGAHGHLVEYGHRMVIVGVNAEVVQSYGAKRVVTTSTTRVPPYPFMRPAAFETQGEQNDVIVASLQQSLAEHGTD